MAAPKENEGELVFPLDGGMTNTAIADVIQPPMLNVSNNTRLSYADRGGPTKAPELNTYVEYGSVPDGYGIVPAGHVDSSVLLHRFYTCSKRITGTSYGDLVISNRVASAAKQSPYFGMKLDSAGPVGTSYNTLPPVRATAPAVVRYGENTIFASAVGLTDGSTRIQITVRDSSDRVVIPPQEYVIVTYNNSFPWVGMTVTTGDGVHLWYVDDDAGNDAVWVRTLSISGTTLTLGTATKIASPGGASLQPSVCAYLGGNRAWLICASTTAGQVGVWRVNLTTLSSLSPLDIGAEAFGAARTAINVSPRDGTFLVAAYTDQTTGRKVVNIDPTAMTVTWTASPGAGSSYDYQVGVNFYEDPAYGTVAIAAFDNLDGSPGSSTYPQIDFLAYSTGSSTPQWTSTLPFYRLLGNGVTFANGGASNSELFPVWCAMRSYDASVSSAALAYVTDPAIELLTHTYVGRTVPIARFGVDLAAFTSGNLYPGWYRNSTSGFCHLGPPNKLIFTYMATDGVPDYPARLYPRYVQFDMTSRQVRYAIGDGGQALIAGPLPAYWDGNELSEVTPLHIPHIYASATSGMGPNLTGTYRYRAVVRWVDACGQTHRSQPSEPYAIGPSGTKARIWVTVPATLRDGINHNPYVVEIYATDNTGTGTYYLLTSIERETGTTDGCIYFLSVPDTDTSKPAIYTTNAGASELPPTCPGAWWDVAVIGRRAWAIDAENRSRALYSKLKQAGTSYEFNEALEIEFPATAGKLMAVSELDGNPLFLAENGLFVVYGDGPNNNGTGSPFTEPRRISDHTCTSLESVRRTPVGVIFKSGNRFGLARPGGQVEILQDFDPDANGTIIGTTIIRNAREVVFWTNSSTHAVWNYERNAWTQWEYDGMQCAAMVPLSSRVLLYSNGGKIQRIGLGTYSSTLQMYFRTGWIQPAGPQGDCAMHELIFQARYLAEHGVTITVYYDYNTSDSVTRSWTSTEVFNVTAGSRYTLAVQLNRNDMRACRIDITETGASGRAMQPLSVTLRYSVQKGAKRRALLAGAVK